MIAKLTKAQIGDNWDLIELAIQRSLPPTADSVNIHEVQQKLMSGELDCWVLFEQDNPDDEVKYYAVATTAVVYDIGTTDKNLLIYSLTSFADHIPTKVWKEGLIKIKKYGKSKGCRYLVGYSGVERIIEMSKVLGGDVEVRVIKFNLEV